MGVRGAGLLRVESGPWGRGEKDGPRAKGEREKSWAGAGVQ